ncbi:hypothetical protein PHSC3_000676 [Chlamydiales bacterium STE3]|nr:hypothetical protein PHSC3_000676 [Chlamydiales bacterium STE3]
MSSQVSNSLSVAPTSFPPSCTPNSSLDKFAYEVLLEKPTSEERDCFKLQIKDFKSAPPIKKGNLCFDSFKIFEKQIQNIIQRLKHLKTKLSVYMFKPLSKFLPRFLPIL